MPVRDGINRKMWPRFYPRSGEQCMEEGRRERILTSFHVIEAQSIKTTSAVLAGKLTCDGHLRNYL